MKSVDPVMLATTAMAFVVPTSPPATVPVNEAVTTPDGVITGVKVPVIVPAVSQLALGVTVPACITVDSVVVATAPVESANVAPAVAVAVPVLVTAIATTAAVDQENTALNWNTAVPCSVTVAVPGIIVVMVLGVTPFPTLTLVKVAPGPKPAAVTVTSVPTGPEAGDTATVGVFNAKVVVATLPMLSVKVNADPVVIAGRLTVPVYLPAVVLVRSDVITFELNIVAGSAVNAAAETVIAVPAKVAAVAD